MTGNLAEGTALQGGRYIVGPLLGEGGFGITYRGDDTRLGRKVAIKELFIPGGERVGETVTPPASYTEQTWGKAIKNFLLEARTLAGLDYPGIVPVYDYFEQNNTAYMVMKFVAGTPLSRYVIEHGGTLDEDEALAITLQVGRALSVVHGHNLLHRDIKPSNIILAPDSQAVLVDFGAAREFAIDRSLIQTAIISAGFSPPEQFYALSRKGPYSDVFSLAATCYFMIAGVTPGGEAKQTPRPRTFAALNHALAYNAYERPATVADFLDELQGRKPIPATTVQVLGEPLPEDSDSPATRLGLPSFAATYAAAAPPVVAGAASQLVANPAGLALAEPIAAPSPSRLLASSATTRVVARPAARRSTNQLSAPVRITTGERLLPVPTAQPHRPLRLLVAAILVATAVYIALALSLTSGGDKGGISALPSPSATAAPVAVSATATLTATPTLSPTIASSPTGAVASPTLPPTVITPLSPRRTAVPAQHRVPTAIPHPSSTPRPSSGTAPVASATHRPPPDALFTPTPGPHPLPSNTPHPPGGVLPAPTFAPTTPTGHPTPTADDGHRGGILPTHAPPPSPTPAPTVAPTDTPVPTIVLPTPQTTEDPPTLTPEPSDTPQPPATDTPQPPATDTPKPLPSDTPAPPTPTSSGGT